MTLVIVDTNVVVSGLLNPSGPPGKVLDLIAKGTVIPVVTSSVLREYRGVVARPKFRAALEGRVQAVDEALEHIEAIARHESTPQLGSLRVRDPKDQELLDLALAARASWLVTGDLDLLALAGHPEVSGLNIATAADFCLEFSP